MNTKERTQCLQEIDLFSSFSEQELQIFAQNIAEVTLAPGELLFQEGELAQDMFILLEGWLKVFKESRLIMDIKPVDYVGEMAIIEAKPRSATVRAEEPSLLLKVTMEQFQEYFAIQPRSLVSMMMTLSRRIRKNTEIIAEDFEKVNMLIHDMKNGLVSFLFLDLLEKEISDHKGQKYIERMREARNNLAAMMNEALASAKGLYHPQLRRPVSLSDLIHDLVENDLCVYPDLTDKRIKISVKAELPELSVNGLDIRRILVNLVLNGAQASKPGDTIEIELDGQDDFAVVHVKDKGEGIADHLKEKIFQPHFTTKPDGNGLGVISCKQIVEEQYGGALTFQSTPGEGSVFSFVLPLSLVDNVD